MDALDLALNFFAFVESFRAHSSPYNHIWLNNLLIKLENAQQKYQ